MTTPTAPTAPGADQPATLPPPIPYNGPVPPNHAVALRYEEDGTRRFFDFPFPSLAAAEDEDKFLDLENHPLQCTECRRPFRAFEAVSFTLIFTCPHWPDDSMDSFPNEAVKAIIPPRFDYLTAPLGDVIAVKQHAVPADIKDEDFSQADGLALRLVNIELDDLPVVNLMLCEAMHRLWDTAVDGWRYFVPDEAASRLTTPGPDGRFTRVFPLVTPRSFAPATTSWTRI
uniref:Uncharacterized protein n=1 Tax=Mycena chlorophos TaxID=658473 RepID=A0ABQ0L529_MYCCL|nr:predicted protein [Mycena chlorophos]